MQSNLSSCPWLQQGCADALWTPLEDQRIQIEIVYGFLAFCFIAICSATCAVMCRCAQDAGVVHTPAQKKWRRILFFAAFTASLIGAAACVCNMKALVYNAEAIHYKSMDEIDRATESESSALVWSAAFDITYSVQFFFGILTQITIFEYLILLYDTSTEFIPRHGFWKGLENCFGMCHGEPNAPVGDPLQQELLRQQEELLVINNIDTNKYHMHRTRRAIRLGAPLLCNMVGILFGCIAAYGAIQASQDLVKIKNAPNFKALKADEKRLQGDFNASRASVADFLICGCISQFFVVLMLFIERRHVLKNEPALDVNQKRILTFVIIMASIRFSSSIIDAVSSTASLRASEKCKDPCGECQGCLALLWSFNVFFIYIRAALLFIFEPAFIVFVLICIQNADTLLNAP
jgi:hypothetical protein